MSIVIIGAGPNLGLAIARRFGREGLAVGLVSRSQPKLDDLAGHLEADGMRAAGAAADIRDADALADAITTLAEQLGPSGGARVLAASRPGVHEADPRDERR